MSDKSTFSIYWDWMDEETKNTVTQGIKKHGEEKVMRALAKTVSPLGDMGRAYLSLKGLKMTQGTEKQTTISDLIADLTASQAIDNKDGKTIEYFRLLTAVQESRKKIRLASIDNKHILFVLRQVNNKIRTGVNAEKASDFVLFQIRHEAPSMMDAAKSFLKTTFKNVGKQDFQKTQQAELSLALVRAAAWYESAVFVLKGQKKALADWLSVQDNMATAEEFDKEVSALMNEMNLAGEKGKELATGFLIEKMNPNTKGENGSIFNDADLDKIIG